jgi:DNA-binding CsgD family transcriptional regulator
MARTLFFLEALTVAAMALLYPAIAADFSAFLLSPLAAAFLLPLAAALAAGSLPRIFEALAAAFSGRRPRLSEGCAASAIEEFSGYARLSALVGFLLSSAGALMRLGANEARRPAVLSWIIFGAYLCLYGCLEALILATLSRAAGRLQAISANADMEGAASDLFARRYGLSPREVETAAAIVSGSSYKETAAILGVSLATVKAHITSVYRKTGTRDKIGLVLLLRQEKGETEPNSPKG